MQVEALAMAVVTLTTTQQLLLHLANEVQLGVLTDVDGDRKLVHDRRQQEEEQRDGDRDRDTGVVHLHGDAAGPGAHHQSDDHRLHEQHQLDEPQEEQRGVEPEERVMCVLVTAPAAETRALLAAVLAAVLTAGRQTAAQQRHNGADPAQIERFKVTTQNLVFVASAVMVMVVMMMMVMMMMMSLLCMCSLFIRVHHFTFTAVVGRRGRRITLTVGTGGRVAITTVATLGEADVEFGQRVDLNHGGGRQSRWHGRFASSSQHVGGLRHWDTARQTLCHRRITQTQRHRMLFADQQRYDCGRRQRQGGRLTDGQTILVQVQFTHRAHWFMQSEVCRRWIHVQHQLVIGQCVGQRHVVSDGRAATVLVAQRRDRSRIGEIVQRHRFHVQKGRRLRCGLERRCVFRFGSPTRLSRARLLLARGTLVALLVFRLHSLGNTRHGPALELIVGQLFHADHRLLVRFLLALDHQVVPALGAGPGQHLEQLLLVGELVDHTTDLAIEKNGQGEQEHRDHNHGNTVVAA
mmetsp:Transcript_17796/g.53421  ORF Transcript_17796/g.53421 Transcript_17796/m.53421 type:complete len:520 (-) Transcript_17796:1450-3009(-)